MIFMNRKVITLVFSSLLMAFMTTFACAQQQGFNRVDAPAAATPAPPQATEAEKVSSPEMQRARAAGYNSPADIPAEKRVVKVRKTKDLNSGYEKRVELTQAMLDEEARRAKLTEDQKRKEDLKKQD